MTSSLETGTAFNASMHPVVDRHGKPFAPNCRVKFRIPSYYINTDAGEGTLTRIDEYGGCYLVSDKPLAIRDRNGTYTESRREVYSAMGRFKDGRYVTAHGLGDPLEHGVTECYIDAA